MSISKNIIENLNENDSLLEMANLTPKRTGLNVVIWSEQNGESRNKSDKLPRFKILGRNYEISLSLEENPKELARSGKIKQSDKKDIQEAIDYVVKNLDLFLKHYNNSPFVYDDDDLKNDLKQRGYYKN